jgi:hypothetical protein
MGPRRKPPLWKVWMSGGLAMLWLVKGVALDRGDGLSLTLDLLTGVAFSGLGIIEWRQRRRADTEV